MLIEFAGASGSGKTTISGLVIEELQRRGRRVDAVHPDHLTLAPRALRSIFTGGLCSPTLQNLFLDLRAIARSPWRSEDERLFLRFCRRAIHRNAPSRLTAMNCYRSVLRKIGVFSWLRSRDSSERLSLVDEGMIQAAHAVLASPRHPPDPAEIDEFLARVPSPDLVVHVGAPSAILESRALARDDRPCRGSPDDVLCFVAHGAEIFQRLLSHERFADYIFAVNYSSNSNELARELARDISDRILQLDAVA